MIQAKTGALGALNRVRSIPNLLRIALKDRAARNTAQQTGSGPTLKERQDHLVQFYGRYEDLVETLCDAAQFGATQPLEARYAAHRKWMQAEYPALQKFVVAYLQYCTYDADQTLEMSGEECDAFEALYSAANLGVFIKHDDGNMISRINRTRHALTLYGDHLRQLIAKSA